MKITLTPYYGNQPFQDYPILRSIWKSPLNRLAEEGSHEALTEENAFYQEQGIQRPDDIFLIMNGDHVIGITGFFFQEDPTTVFLRWHGIIPEYRRQGLSSLALRQMLTLAQHQFPEIQTVIENLPESQPDIIGFFQSLGFTPVGSNEFDEWSHMTWQHYIADVSTILNHNVGFVGPSVM